MKDNPKRFKFNRLFRVKLGKFEVSNSYLNASFYTYGLKALENGKLKKRHLHSVFRLLKKMFKKRITLRFNASLIAPVSSKPLESRMGKGKGPRDHWECPVKKGMVLLEIGNLPLLKLNFGLIMVQTKLPIATKVFRITY